MSRFQHRTSPKTRNSTLAIERLEQRRLLSATTMSGTGLLGQYFNNTQLETPALVRVDAGADFSWGTNSPTASLSVDNFAVRWSGQIEAQFTETYTFQLTTDDRSRLWVNGLLLINHWSDGPVATNTGSIALIAGRRYDIQIEYADTSSDAQVKLEWSSASQALQVVPTSQLFPSHRGALTHEVWNTINGAAVVDLTASATFPNQPSSIDTVTDAIAPSNLGDNFGQRLRGIVYPPTTGMYTFYVAADQAAELWLSHSTDAGDKQLIAKVSSPTNPLQWTAGTEQRSAPVTLVAGQGYYLEALHKESTGADHLAIGWTKPGTATVAAIAAEYLVPATATVRAYAEVPITTEGSSTKGSVTVVRSGMPLTAPLTVAYTVRGTATSGVDIVTLPGTITIPAGAASATLEVTALADASVEGTENTIVELMSSTEYEVGLLSERTVTVTIQDDAPAPSGGTQLLNPTALANYTYFGGSFSAVTDPTYGTAIQAVLATKPASIYNAQLRQSIVLGTIKTGDLLLAEFYARSLNAPGSISVVLELASNPYTKSLSKGMPVSTSWTKVQLPFIAAMDHAAGTASFEFQIGTQAQTLQFAQISLLNYGPPQDLTPSYGLDLNGAAYGNMSTVAVTGQPFDQAFQINTITTPAQSYQLQAIARNQGRIVKGETIRVEFSARSISGSNPKISFNIQDSFGAYTTRLSQTLLPSSNWQTYQFDLTFALSDATLPAEYTVDQLQIAFNVGFAAQSVQIGGFKLTNLAKNINYSDLPTQTASVTYGGRSGTDAWRASADTRIEDNRTADIVLNVVDALGNPVDGAVVNLRQQRHQYKFGAAITGYDSMLSPTGGAEALKYQSEIKRLFNTVVLENNLKWPGFLGNRQLGIDAAQWAVDNNLYLRGHNAVWPSRNNMPTSVWTQYDTLLANSGQTAADDYLRDTVRARVVDAALTFNDLAGEWDVVNEPYDNHAVMDALGDDEMLEWFRIFRANDPDGKRLLNDYSIFPSNGGDTAHRANFDYWLGRLTAANLIEGFGEQSHYGESNLTDITTLAQLIEHYDSTYQVPIAITEFDVNSKDQQLQADYLRDYMTMVFSEPATNEFVQWGFWSKTHWLPEAALYRDDFSIKSNGQAYEDLVFGNWWTDDRATTGTTGQVAKRGFLGDYLATITINGHTETKSFTLAANGQPLQIKLAGVMASTSTLNLVEGAAAKPVTLVLSEAPTTDVTIAVSGDAQVSAAPTSVVFTAANWNQPQTVSIAAIADAISEGLHAGQVSFLVTSSDARFDGLSIVPIAVSITESNLATLAIAATSAIKSEGNSGNTPFTFTVTRGGNLAGVSTATYTVIAAAPNLINITDVGGFVPSGTVSFAANESSKIITINVTGDTTAELDENFKITLTNPSAGTSLLTAAAFGTILNDDTNYVIAGTSATKTEGNTGTTPYTFTVTRSGLTASASSVNFAVTGSVTSGATAADFAGSVFPTGTLSFAANETSKLVTFNVQGETVVEANEGFIVTISAPTIGTITTATAAGTIQNDDTSLSIAATSAVKAEGNSGTTPFTFTVTRSGNLAIVSTVTYKVIGAAPIPINLTDVGGVAPTGTVTFGANESSKLITINVTGDTTVETDENMQVMLSSPSAGTSITTATAIGTVQNDDNTTFAIAATSAIKSEGNSATTPFMFTITRTGNTASVSTVNYTVTATGPNLINITDVGGFVPAGTVVFNSGESSKVITINVTGDVAVEPDESFKVTLSSPSAGTAIATGIANGTILNDDTGYAIVATSAVKVEGNSGTTTFTFTVTRSGVTTAASTVNFTVAGSLTNGATAADFGSGLFPAGTVAFAAGETSRVISISVLADTAVELSEGFIVTLSGPSLGTVIAASASGTIQNDD